MYSNNKHIVYSDDKLLFSLPKYPFDYLYLVNRLKDFKSPRNKIGLMIKKGQIVRVKKGLYVLPIAFGGEVNKFLLANLIFGPSYVSFETALSYWGLIPEKVTTMISVTTKRNKTFNTPLGVFLYRYRNPFRYMYGFIKQGSDNTSSFLIAGKEKALCDILSHSSIRSMKECENFITDNMRIDLEEIKDLDVEVLHCIAKQYSNISVRLFYKWYTQYFKTL